MIITDEALLEFLNETPMIDIDNDESRLNYNDRFVTRQQKRRDEKVTELLEAYVTFYKNKVKHSTWCRYIILIPCMLVIAFFAALLIWISINLMNTEGVIQITEMVAFITACISFISLIIGLLTIITKYFFPEDDEKYIATIVQAIQENDLENKRENAKNSSH